MRDAIRNERLVGSLTANQGRLYAYILSLTADADAAHDVLQQTNLVLWRKVSEWPDDAPFMAWACRVAYYEVLSHRRDQHRDRLTFDESLLARLAEESPERGDAEGDPRQRALRKCMARLSEDHRRLLEERYAGAGTVGEIARSRGWTVGSVSQALYRIRQDLLACMRHRLGEVRP